VNPIAQSDARPVVRMVKQQPRVEAGSLPTKIEQRPRRVAPSLTNPLGIEIVSYFIGHGQQLARRRLQALAAANTLTYAATPFLDQPSRQVLRWRGRHPARGKAPIANRPRRKRATI
jgi:hypothetical protein